MGTGNHFPITIYLVRVEISISIITTGLPRLVARGIKSFLKKYPSQNYCFSVQHVLSLIYFFCYDTTRWAINCGTIAFLLFR